MKTKKLTAALIAFSLVLGGNSVFAASSTSPVQIASADFDYSKEAMEALDYINKIRKDAGLGEVKLNPFLTKAAENHAKYLNAGNPYDHDEIEGKKGFTGVTPKDRVLAVGGDSQLAQGLVEVLTVNDSTVKAAIDTLVNTAYHRTPFLDPYTMEFGVGFEGKKFAMVSKTRGSATTDISMYPYNGQKNVPTTFVGADEDPNPLRKFGIERSGYVISFYPPHVLDTKTIDATIKDSKGTGVPFFSEWYMGYWFFYTKQPLKNGETYTVSVNYKPLYEEEYEGKTLNRTWSFTTVADVSSGGSKSETTSPKPETQSEYRQVTVLIDGVKQTFDQPAIVKNGSTLVPLRGVFEALKADVKWDQPSQTVTAKKGDTTIKLTVGQSTATVNGKSVALAAKAEIVNGSTMVPLRFVSEALGADVKWDNATSTATITSPAGNVGGGQVDQGGSQVVNGIKVQYGKHHYGSKNQAEYDNVMAKLKQEVDSRLGSVKVGGNDFSEYYERYLNGDRASNYERNTIESRGLTSAEKTLKVLVDLGLKKDDILKLTKLSIVGADILSSAKAVEGGSPDSLADLLLRGVYDCDPEAYLYSAIFDMYGYNTAIVAGDNHASAFVQINDEWVSPMTGTFAKSDASYLLSQSGFYIRSEPTFGGTLKGKNGQVEQGGSQVVNGIKVQYGKHNYGSKTQADYDKAMAKLKQEVDSRYSTVKVGGDRYEEYYYKYLDGERASNYERNTIESRGLTNAEKSFETLMSLGLSKDKIIELMKLSNIGVDLIGTAKVLDDGSPYALGDLLLRGVRDCDPEAQLYSAIFDMYGYNTAIVAGNNHASAYVQVNGVWISPGNGTFAPSNISSLLSQSGFYIMTQPTFGGSLE